MAKRVGRKPREDSNLPDPKESSHVAEYTSEILQMSLDLEIKNRNKSLTEIGKDPKLQECVKLIEKAIELIVIIFYNKHQTKDEGTLAIVGHRLTDDLTVAINLILTGWWYIAVMIFRDILEIILLLYYFREDRSRINVWRSTEGKERLKKFRPAILRDSLKKRFREAIGDDERNKAIDKRYQLYSELGTHLTPKGVFSTSYHKETLQGWCVFNKRYLSKYIMELANLSGLSLDSFMKAWGKENIPSEVLKEIDSRLEKLPKGKESESYSDLKWD